MSGADQPPMVLDSGYAALPCRVELTVGTLVRLRKLLRGKVTGQPEINPIESIPDKTVETRFPIFGCVLRFIAPDRKQIDNATSHLRGSDRGSQVKHQRALIPVYKKIAEVLRTVIDPARRPAHHVHSHGAV